MDKDSTDAKPNSTNKRRKHYANPSQKRRRYVLEPGLKGFLCSCNFREKDCIRESYNILNEYADILYGTEAHRSEAQDEVVSGEDDADDLQKEIESLKSADKATERRFQVVESGAKNFLFIRTTIEDPVKLTEMIVQDISERKKQKTRFLLRLIPIEVTCKAYVDDIQKACEPLLEKYFQDSPKSFSIVFNHRNNNQISKDNVIKVVAEMVSAKRSDHKVDLKNAEVSILIEVIKGIALIGVVPNFTKYKKYNLHTICEDSSTEKNPDSIPSDNADGKPLKDATEVSI